MCLLLLGCHCLQHTAMVTVHPQLTAHHPMHCEKPSQEPLHARSNLPLRFTPHHSQRPLTPPCCSGVTLARVSFSSPLGPRHLFELSPLPGTCPIYLANPSWTKASQPAPPPGLDSNSVFKQSVYLSPLICMFWGAKICLVYRWLQTHNTSWTYCMCSSA